MIPGLLVFDLAGAETVGVRVEVVQVFQGFQPFPVEVVLP
jgi:hypothetical protein